MSTPNDTKLSPVRPELRQASRADAEILRRFGETLLAETDFFHRSSAERARNESEMAQIIDAFSAAENSALVNAWIGTEPVGEAILMGGQLDRIRHTATLGIGVLSAWHGTGVAQQLLNTVEEIAAAHGIMRLELTVMTANKRAIRFYEKQGYRHEGQKIGAVRIDGEFRDEFLMAKYIGHLAVGREHS